MKNTLLSRYIQKTDGSISIISAVMALALVGAAGLGVDTYILQSNDTAVRHIVDLTCERITDADIAIFPTALSANKMAKIYADNLKVTTATPDAMISITDPINNAVVSGPVTVSAEATFKPTLTAVFGAKDVQISKKSTCERRPQTQTGTNPKCNVVAADLNITIKKTITVDSLAKYAVLDNVGGGSKSFIYTIIDKDQKIVKRELFSSDLKLDPTSLDNGGKNQIMYIQVLNKDGSIPELQKQCTLNLEPPSPPPLCPSCVEPPKPPPVCPNCPPPPKCTSVSGYADFTDAYEDALELTGDKLSDDGKGTNFKISNLQEFVAPDIKTSVDSSWFDGWVNVSHPTRLNPARSAPISKNFTPTEKTQMVTDAERILKTTVEKAYLIALFVHPDKDEGYSYNDNAIPIMNSGYQIEHIYSSATANWQHPVTGQCFRTLSPIVIDLTNKGKIETTGISTAQNAARSSVGKTISFDMLGAGIPQKMEWIAGNGQGFLIDNRDGNAAKDMNGKRLFGNDVKHANGYAKLASTLAPDKDGMLTGDALKGLAVWVDNGDGVVQEGELKTLAELGITQISTRMESVKDDKGDMLMRSYVIRNNKRVMSEDVWFGVARQ
jgi:hypothetical protein